MHYCLAELIEAELCVPGCERYLAVCITLVYYSPISDYTCYFVCVPS